MERGNDVRAVKEIEGWEDKQAEWRRENMGQYAVKKGICPVFIFALLCC